MDAVDAETDVAEDEDGPLPVRGRPGPRRPPRGGEDLGRVYAAVDVGDDAQAGGSEAVGERLDGAGGRARAEPLANLLSQLFALCRKVMDGERGQRRGRVDEPGDYASVRRVDGAVVLRVRYRRERSSPIYLTVSSIFEQR